MGKIPQRQTKRVLLKITQIPLFKKTGAIKEESKENLLFFGFWHEK